MTTKQTPAIREQQRGFAEDLYGHELAALAADDDRVRPANWRMSPQAVVTYLMGGKTRSGTAISPKYIGNRRLIETAVATLATDRALLILGVPGTAKSWVSEHLAAAISGSSRMLIQCTAGTDENQIRYGWNYAILLAQGPSRAALVPTPLMRAMEEGRLVRFEELTRMGSDVQDTLITVLSEKILPIAEINDAILAMRGFNLIATANSRDKGVNELSSALKRRFNVVVLPLPSSLEEEQAIVIKRVSEIGTSLELPKIEPAEREIARIVTIFRELRDGQTLNGKLRLKSPSGSLSTAEAIAVTIGGMGGGRAFRLRCDRRAESRGQPGRRGDQGPGAGSGSDAGIPRDGGTRAQGLDRSLRRPSRRSLSVTEDRRGLFGIRHHGPGSARSLLAALDDLDPSIVLIEGPADVSDLLHFAAAPGMVPPVAILAHGQEDPANATFFPFAVYSPEWQAIHWALARHRKVRFIDLPAENRLAIRAKHEPDENGSTEPSSVAGDEAVSTDQVDAIRRDPLSYLAGIAGYEDGEAWWNALIEQGSNGPTIFAAIESAMTELRGRSDLSRVQSPEERQIEEKREAHMRLAIAAALKETEGRVAVVCGAWHVPALRETRPSAEDRALLKGMAKIKISATWVPWTETRLATSTGYGAGVISPGWYAHVWNARTNAQDEAVAHSFTAGWQVKVAALLRRHGRPAPTASAIEAVRLAEMLASLRDLAMPGLEEMQAASLATLCLGEPAPMALIACELVVGGGVGSIADGVPLMPLAADLAYWQKRLKLKPEAMDRDVSLDLRTETGLAKSHLLHRLALLHVPWGQLQSAGSSRGTFREIWVLRWEPEFSVALAEALVHGTTIEQAAGNAAIAAARRAPSLAAVADVVRGCLLSGLDDAARLSIVELQTRLVATSDIGALAAAVPPLATILRYGTARATSVEEVAATGDQPFRSRLCRASACLPRSPSRRI